MFNTKTELLNHFIDGGDLLDTETGHVYIADVNGDGEFFGIMVGDPVPENIRRDVSQAVGYAMDTYPAPGTLAPNRMGFMEAPGWWFGELAEEVIANPSRFMAVRYEV